MKYVLFLIAILFSNQAVALNCEKQPTCEELNYSKDDDPNCAEDGYILCPFDFSYKKCAQPDCQKMGYTQSNKSDWCGKLAFCPTDKTYTACKALCEIGDVYYADGTCGYVQDYDNTKTPVGIVFYTYDEGRHGKVISLHHLTFDENFNFNPENPFGQDNWQPHFGLANVVPQIKGFSSDQELINALQKHEAYAFGGFENTDILINTKPESCTYQEKTLNYNKFCQATMALAAHNFYPPKVDSANPITGQGKWYMPSVGELVLLWNPDMSKLKSNGVAGDWWKIKNTATPDICDKVDETLQALKDKNIQTSLLEEQGNFLWSSSYLDAKRYLAVHLCKNCGGTITMDGAYGVKPMRAMLAFQKGIATATTPLPQAQGKRIKN